MPHDQAYLEAEKKIEQARRSGATELDLRNMGLSELPESIGQLTNVLKLNFEREFSTRNGNPNQLTALPDSLGRLTQLQYLNLSNNQLTTMPEWIGQFTHMHTLILSNNLLTKIPESLGLLSELNSLDLSHNQLKSLPGTIGQLRNLKQLVLSHNPLNELPESMSQLVSLRSLYLAELLLDIYPEWLGKLAQLESLSLTNNNLEALPGWIVDLKELRIIHCRNNFLRDIPSFLLQLEHLDEIRLDDNPLNPKLAAAYKEGTLKNYLRTQISAMNKRNLKIFLCHASQDKPMVLELHEKLLSEGWIDPWLDAKKLLPGQDWQAEIKIAVETADNVIIFLSNTSINKDGFIQKELRLAKDIALEKSEGSVFLIPLRLDDCAVPMSLQIYQWADYFGTGKEQTYGKLVESLKLRLEEIKRKEVYTK